MGKIKMTQNMMYKGLSAKATLGIKQFKALGYPRPFKGWKTDIVGTYFTRDQIEEFLYLKGDHLKNRKQKTSRKGQPKKNLLSVYVDPRWKTKRRIIYKRDKYRCVNCGKGTMDGVGINAHHLIYIIGAEVWEVPDWYLVTLCNDCHRAEHCKLFKPPPKIHKK